MKPVFISSNAFPKKDLDAIFHECDAHGIQYLELGSGVLYDSEARKKIINRSKHTHILLHNYIPAPKIPFALNLAARDQTILRESRLLARTALDLSAEIKAPFYGVHAGFAYDAVPQYLGKAQTHLAHFSLSEARKIFEESLYELANYAKQVGVTLLLENNVLPAFNLLGGENQSYLMVGIEDTVSLLETVNAWGVGLLVDTGHLAVSAKTLGFDTIDFITQVRHYIGAFQVSENDGMSDTHGPIRLDSWCLGIVRQFPHHTVTLEVNDHLGEVIENLSLFV